MKCIDVIEVLLMVLKKRERVQVDDKDNDFNFVWEIVEIIFFFLNFSYVEILDVWFVLISIFRNQRIFFGIYIVYFLYGKF